MEMKELVKQGIQEALDRAVRAGTLPQGEYPEVVLESTSPEEVWRFCDKYCYAVGAHRP